MLTANASEPWDWTLWITAGALCLMSGIAMASASVAVDPDLALRHGMWMAVGWCASLAVARTNYRTWTEFIAIAYGMSLAALLLVPMAGAVRLGATRWLSVFGFSVQPSEFAKLTTVWMLARYLSGQATPLPGVVFWGSLLIAGPPAFLVLMQPDLGSASIFGAIWLGMVWLAGARRRNLMTVGVLFVALCPVGWHALKEYQRDRLLAFINPHADPLGTGFSIIQSTIAIGSGQFWGRGWFAGTQNQLSFLPERHSDFIFSVIGEEWGFLGCVAVVVAFGILLLRVQQLALRTVDPQGRLLAAGIGSWLAYQAFVNIGMVMGLLPVVGVPLPFVSYGGSSMVTLLVALGLLQSVHRSERS